MGERRFVASNRCLADGTTVFPNGGQIVDDNGAVWTIGASLTIQRNGTWAAGGVGSEILWTREAIYAFGVDRNWWRWQALDG
jgi:hypothetical protein